MVGCNEMSFLQLLLANITMLEQSECSWHDVPKSANDLEQLNFQTKTKMEQTKKHSVIPDGLWGDGGFRPPLSKERKKVNAVKMKA